MNMRDVLEELEIIRHDIWAEEKDTDEILEQLDRLINTIKMPIIFPKCYTRK